MALQTGQSKRSGRVTDDDGRAFEVPVGGIAETVGGSAATAAAPASGASVVTIASASLPAGVYRVTVQTQQAGTVDANTVNLRFRKGATVVSSVPSLATQFSAEFPRVVLDGTLSLSIILGGSAGGAGSIYIGTIQATRVE